MSPTEAAVTALEFQNDVLKLSRERYLLKEAERKHFEARIVSNSPGKSHAERVINAQAQESWFTFQSELARLESDYEFQRLKFNLLEKSWHNAYQDAKLGEGLIRKQR